MCYLAFSLLFTGKALNLGCATPKLASFPLQHMPCCLEYTCPDKIPLLKRGRKDGTHPAKGTHPKAANMFNERMKNSGSKPSPLDSPSLHSLTLGVGPSLSY